MIFSGGEMKRLIVNLSFLSILILVSQAIAVPADLDGDARDEDVFYKNGSLIVKDDDGKEVMREKVNVDLSPRLYDNEKKVGIEWHTLRMDKSDIVLIYVRSSGLTQIYADAYIVYWGPMNRPGLLTLTISSVAEAVIDVGDIDSDGNDEVIAHCSCLMDPKRFEAALLGAPYSDLQSPLKETEKLWFPYIIDYEPVELIPYMWELERVAKTDEMYERWLGNCLSVARKLERKNRKDLIKEIQTLVESITRERVKTQFSFLKPVELQGKEGIERIVKIRETSYSGKTKTSPLEFIAEPGMYQGKLFVLDGESIDKFGIMDNENFKSWRAGYAYDYLLRYSDRLEVTFTFEIAKKDTYHLILKNNEEIIKRVYLRLEKYVEESNDY
jgi:hypothetical protein